MIDQRLDSLDTKSRLSKQCDSHVVPSGVPIATLPKQKRSCTLKLGAARGVLGGGR